MISLKIMPCVHKNLPQKHMLKISKIAMLSLYRHNIIFWYSTKINIKRRSKCNKKFIVDQTINLTPCLTQFGSSNPTRYNTKNPNQDSCENILIIIAQNCKYKTDSTLANSCKLDTIHNDKEYKCRRCRKAK